MSKTIPAFMKLVSGRKNFFSTLLGSVSGGPANYTNKRQINRSKSTQLLLIFMCIGIPPKEVKLKEAIRLRAYIPF